MKYVYLFNKENDPRNSITFQEKYKNAKIFISNFHESINYESRY